jgi:hypothetical protein
MNRVLPQWSTDSAVVDIHPATPLDHRTLDERWREAALEVIHAQQDYVALEEKPDSPQAEWRIAWLRLWNAESKLRAIDHALKHVSPAFISASANRFTRIDVRA